MSYEIRNLNYDLAQGRISLDLVDNTQPLWKSVNVNAHMKFDGQLSEAQLKEKAKKVAKEALHEAFVYL